MMAMIAITNIVRTWKVRMVRETRLEPWIPRRHIPEKRTRMKTVSSETGKGKSTSPERYPPALPADTIAYNQNKF
jgi:hypothetical protein